MSSCVRGVLGVIDQITLICAHLLIIGGLMNLLIRSDNMAISIRNWEIPAAACQATTHHPGTQPTQEGRGTRRSWTFVMGLAFVMPTGHGSEGIWDKRLYGPTRNVSHLKADKNTSFFLAHEILSERCRLQHAAVRLSRYQVYTCSYPAATTIYLIFIRM